jgi:putative CocE/NonD family hydrolase
MSEKRSAPGAYSVRDHTWIPLTDGCRLAARIWLPDGAERDPVPAVFEYIPYRKGDLTAARDHTLHGYFAARGYASVRVDIRGSGDSDGFLDDEYLAQEQADAVEVIKWLASQPWCTGCVGMIGISWGGSACLQVAARAPRELHAVISVASTDDRYGLDVHYMGGCLNAWDQLSWASTVHAMSALPPDPLVRGEDWRQVWLDRLEHAQPLINRWMRHQRRDDYWKHGSVGEQLQAIRCPVYMVGGWADAYHDTVLRFLASYGGACKGLIGPWAHCYPHEGRPGPAIGFLQEATRWWDHWLKDVPTGIMDEPRLQAWIQDHAGPAIGYEDRPGRWVAEHGWPASSVSATRYWLGNHTLDPEPGPATTIAHESPQAPPSDRGNWCPGGWQQGATDFPPEQSEEDARSATFTSAPLEHDIEILGFPTLRVDIAADSPRAILVARLCDISPDGTSTLISRGLLNLCHRNGSGHPEPLTPGKQYTVQVELGSIGYVLPAGHRLRLGLSTTYWPWVWPAPNRVGLTLRTGQAVLELPVRSTTGLVPVQFGAPESEPPLETAPVGAADPGSRTIDRDPRTAAVTVTDRLASGGERLVPTGITYDGGGTTTFRITEGAPLSAAIDCTRFFALARNGWNARTQVTSSMTCTDEHFHLTTRLEALEGEDRIFTKTWSAAIPRDCM